jgi:NADH-quinone oxidoreductase subunit C
MHNEWANFINASVPNAKATVNAATLGDSSITVDSMAIRPVCEALKTGEHDFNVLQVITGCDYPEQVQLELTYILASFTKNTELLLKVRLPRGDQNNLPKIESVCSVWKAANFQERECYDMLGVNFVGHPDLRRILTGDDWVGHPLRKDYQVQEMYRDMVVNPIHKMNIAEREFGARHEYIDGGATSIDNYNVEPPPGYVKPVKKTESAATE